MPIPKKYAPLKIKSAKDRVFYHIQEWIITGQLHPGEQLYDVALAEFFSVSRTPIREALLLLEAQGLVRMLPGKSTIVTEISEENAGEYYRPLAELQKLAAELCCSQVTPEQIKDLHKRNAIFTQAVNSGDIMKIIMADADFHGYLSDISGNKYISDYCRALLVHVARLEHFYFSDRLNAEHSIEGHKYLISLLEARDIAVGEYLKNSWLKTLYQCEARLKEKI